MLVKSLVRTSPLLRVSMMIKHEIPANSGLH